MPPRTFWVYIMASPGTRVLYTGMTSDLPRRVWMHRQREGAGFTARYNVTQLVYCEEHSGLWAAIEREKQLKAWRREKKVRLIEAQNPAWLDLADGWGAPLGL